LKERKLITANISMVRIQLKGRNYVCKDIKLQDALVYTTKSH
jgi:hypothetical protein